MRPYLLLQGVAARHPALAASAFALRGRVGGADGQTGLEFSPSVLPNTVHIVSYFPDSTTQELLVKPRQGLLLMVGQTITDNATLTGPTAKFFEVILLPACG